MTTPLTFEEFRASARVLGAHEVAQTLNMEVGDLEALLPPTAHNITVYADGAAWGAMALTGAKDRIYWTLIDGKERMPALRETMEAILYCEHYAPEVVDPDAWTLPLLTDLLETYCDLHGIEPASADELLCGAYDMCCSDVPAICAGWLEWYVILWDATEEAEDTTPDDDDYIITDCGPLGSHTHVSCNGRTIYQGPSEDAAYATIRATMRAEKFYPNVFRVSDHGNVTFVADLFEGETA